MGNLCLKNSKIKITPACLLELPKGKVLFVKLYLNFLRFYLDLYQINCIFALT